MGTDFASKLKRILEEMKEYYRQRAPEYDEWFYRKGRYDRGREADQTWFTEVQMVFQALDSMNLKGDILEVASGTGIWTERLVKNATSVTSLDSSEEMIEKNKARVNSDLVKYVVADFYEWTPDRTYDAVAFSFWISHVPSSKLDEFASKVSLCLKPDGRVFFVDQQRESMSTAVDHTLNPRGVEVAERKLNDGREFKIIKHFYSPVEIEECFKKNGIRVEVFLTPTHFYYGIGEKNRVVRLGPIAK